MAYEDLGFAERGKGATLLREGQTEKGGRVAVNLFGDLRPRVIPWELRAYPCYTRLPSS